MTLFDLWDEDVSNSTNLKFNFKVIDEKDDLVLLEELSNNKKFIFKTPNGVKLGEMGEYDERCKENKAVLKIAQFGANKVPFLDYEYDDPEQDEGRYRSLGIGKIVSDVNSLDDCVKEMI